MAQTKGVHADLVGQAVTHLPCAKPGAGCARVQQVNSAGLSISHRLMACRLTALHVAHSSKCSLELDLIASALRIVIPKLKSGRLAGERW